MDSESLFSTMYFEIKGVKNFFFRQNKGYKKCILFSFARSNSSHNNFKFMILIRTEAQGSSL